MPSQDISKIKSPNEIYVVQLFVLFKLVCYFPQLDTGGKPSTWFPPGRLVELIMIRQSFFKQ